MTAESGLKWFLRIIAIPAILAFLAAVMPQSWLVYWANRAAPGTPTGILFTYLARMLMGMYGLTGLLCLMMSTDIRRYLPLIWVLGAASVVGTIIGLIALFATVPPDHRTVFFWVVFGDFAEGLAQGVLLVVFLLHIPSRPRKNEPVAV
ncbi:MAG: hypothetical protein NTZ17_02620 [Phycisphaerae bacterium]|nr:hypothetical protein [Phycisphaerae bacterium]